MSGDSKQEKGVRKFENVEEAYAVLSGASAESGCKSLLKRHLTPEIYEELKERRTPRFQCTLLDVIQSGCANLDSGVGVYAPDVDSYETFAPLFDPIIKEYHGITASEIQHPAMDWGNVAKTMSDMDPEGKYVISTRCRVARSFTNFPLTPSMSKEQYLELEELIKSAVAKFSEDEANKDLAGEFHSLATMDPKLQQQLIDDHFLFKEGDRFLDAASALRFWPTGRAIFINHAKNFIIWVGEEDQVRIISMQMGGDLGNVIGRLERALALISADKRLEFAHSPRLGYITFCPTNLGSTMRASVHIKLPKLAADMPKLEKVAEELHLQIRGTRGEHSESEGGIYDISNKRRLGFTEAQLAMDLYEGCKKLIEMEKALA